jgi:hypothetical protein
MNLVYIDTLRCHDAGAYKVSDASPQEIRHSSTISDLVIMNRDNKMNATRRLTSTIMKSSYPPFKTNM